MTRTEEDRTPGKTIRVPTPMWTAYQAVLKRQDSNPTADIHQRIREVIEAGGTPGEIEQLRSGEHELAERKRNRYRRAATSRARSRAGDG
ncbi:hypothetical protein [Actinomadura sp. WMMA1423]|uniref:hypothetical protein n=1 Tax=Actinomadura sp. WMMA1423 TaxID=2591108 RepID=UPI0011471E8A|nr:hypothetical protein [Actinomadura sp. WMMA1423]